MVYTLTDEIQLWWDPCWVLEYLFSQSAYLYSDASHIVFMITAHPWPNPLARSGKLACLCFRGLRWLNCRVFIGVTITNDSWDIVVIQVRFPNRITFRVSWPVFWGSLLVISEIQICGDPLQFVWFLASRWKLVFFEVYICPALLLSVCSAFQIQLNQTSYSPGTACPLQWFDSIFSLFLWSILATVASCSKCLT